MTHQGWTRRHHTAEQYSAGATAAVSEERLLSIVCLPAVGVSYNMHLPSSIFRAGGTVNEPLIFLQRRTTITVLLFIIIKL